ncbi:MAG: hypothetical protein AAB250_12585 [Bdellovibrionota bacterium]
MQKPNSRKLKLVTGLLAFATLLVLFQNCSVPVDFSKFELKAASNGNGTGYDGKPFVNHGYCDLVNVLELKSMILVRDDGSAVLTRENCVDIDPPRPLVATDIRQPFSDSGVLVFENEIYDHYSPQVANRKLTRALCWSMPGAVDVNETQIWYFGDALVLNANGPTLVGRQKTASGATTGKITPLSETRSTTRVVYSGTDPATVNGIYLDIVLGGTLQYGMLKTTLGGVVTQTGGLECFVQALPPFAGN